MIALKKLYSDELLRLALVLSLLKADPNDYLERETQQLLSGLHISNGSDWSSEQEARTLIRPRFVHPKSLDNILINYERDLFEDLNSLGRYANNFDSNNNERIWNNRGPILHTYLVNNVATETVVPQLDTGSVVEINDQEVASDDNVAQEVKVTDEEETEEEEEIERQPDVVVTVSADFLSNHSHTDADDIFSEIATRSFDVNDFLVQPTEMQIKKEAGGGAEENLSVRIKKETDSDDLYSDNAMDAFVPYFSSKMEKFELEEPQTVFDQNIADLHDYNDLLAEERKNFKSELDSIDPKQQSKENLEKYLLENTPLDSEVFELAPMYEEELVLNVKRERPSTSFTSASSSGVSEMEDTSFGELTDIKEEFDEGHTGDELTQEDVDLIEVLWKQDVDMGFSLEDPIHPDGPHATKIGHSDFSDDPTLTEEEIELERKKLGLENKDAELAKIGIADGDDKESDPWAGLTYVVDTETGEYVLQGELPPSLVSGAEDSRFELLEEALQLVDLGEPSLVKNNETVVEAVSVEDTNSSQSDVGEEAAAMLHPAMRHVPPHHPLAHYHNQSLMRSMSVEQRWQDLASLLTIPPPPDQYQHYHQHAHNISAQASAASYAPGYHHSALQAVPEKHHDPYGGAAASLDSSYKVESAHHPQQHDGIYYQNATEMAPPPTNQEGLFQSILNDEDLQLMDMAMNEGMYTMRMLDGAGAHQVTHHNHSHMMMAERDSLSDSAVSSMGSERVPSLSDGEWPEGGETAHDPHGSKFRPYDAAYGRDRNATLQPQKKHHMFGKRCFQEQPTVVPPLVTLEPPRPPIVKYECPEQYQHDMRSMHNDYTNGHQIVPHMPVQPALDLNTPHSSHALLQGGIPQMPEPRYAYATPERVRHNHTYSAANNHDVRPQAVRDKRVRRLTDGSMSDNGSTSGSSHQTRDEKRAKSLGIPMDVNDIINLPMDEFNERLSKHDLSETQLSLIRDIRRRGKNKVAAQNCRKRKLDQITSLADEVRTVRDRKQRTLRDHHSLHAERQRLKERFAKLYRHVFQSLRDPEGRPLSSNHYSLQQAADGNVVLVPKMQQHSDPSMNRTSDEEMERKAKNFEQ